MRPLSAGTRIGPDIEVIGLLHRSNALDVYDAWSQQRGARVTVKTVRPNRLADARTVTALLREGRLLRRLSHPHIVRGYEVLTAPRPAIVLETLRGETLGHLIERSSRRLSTAELGHLGLHLGSGLQYLHAQRILHLDLKPSNAIVEAGRAKLIDLSVARAPGRMRGGRGTWNYMAPEQARGGRIGPAADVWGLGIVLYEAATGHATYDEDSDEDVEYPQLVRRPAPVRHDRRRPPAFAAAIDASLDPDPSRRPPLTDLLVACERAAALPSSEWRFGRRNGRPAHIT